MTTISLPIPSDPLADHQFAVPTERRPDDDYEEAVRLARKAWAGPGPQDDPHDPEFSCPPHLQLETEWRRFRSLFINDLYHSKV